MVLILAGFTAQYATAESFNQEDMAFAFGDSAIATSDFGQMDLLSSQEMVATEGEYVWLRGVFGSLKPAWNYTKSIRVRAHFDIKPHRFSRYWGPLSGNRPHYQITIYRKGIPNSHTNIRIPWGPRTTWGSHQP